MELAEERWMQRWERCEGSDWAPTEGRLVRAAEIRRLGIRLAARQRGTSTSVPVDGNEIVDFGGDGG
jgi:hypothetical protein